MIRSLRAIAVLILVASVVLNLVLLSKILPTTNAPSTSSNKLYQQARATDTSLAGFKSANNENFRIIALCGRSPHFDAAFQKISEWLPISYAGMYHPPEENDEQQTQRVWCEDKIEQWVAQELQRRQLSTKNKPTTLIEVIYSDQKAFKRKSPLNTTLVGQSKEPPKWEGGMHTPSRLTHFQRVISEWGEVATSKFVRCSQDDSKINVYRSRQLWSVAQEEGCAVVHRPAILPYLERFLKHRIQAGLSPANETMTSLLSRQLTNDQARQSLRSKSGFCILITLTTFQPRYSTDALVRHVLCRLLTKHYKPCSAVASWKGVNKQNIVVEKGLENTYEAMKDFKFAITMPNHFQDGYIAEKTLNPYLASSVAITSIPNIGQYVNADGMITCHLPEEELRKVQMYYKGKFEWMPFNTTPEMWNDEVKPIKYDPYANNSTGDEPVLKFATTQWEKALQPCIEEIIQVDQDDSAYIEKLMQPYLLNEGQNSIFDGSYVAMSTLRWFLWKNSPLVGGLEDQIRSLDGMWEQTPGWGKPTEKKFEDAIDYYSKTKNEEGLYRYRPAQQPFNQNTSLNANVLLPSNLQASRLSDTAKCTFCKGEESNFNPDWVVPGTGGNTCGSIKAMAAGQLNGSDICAMIQKEEWVCCPVPYGSVSESLASDSSLALQSSSVSSWSGIHDNVRTVSDSSVLYHELVSKAQQTCSNGLANDTDLSTYLGLSQDGSNDNVPFVNVLLPPDQYPILHRSCFFIPTKPENIDKHRHLLTLYPNSFLFVSVQDHPSIDFEARVIYISGVDSYELLWKKTLGLWDIVSFESSNLFKECDWFFKVDTDTFLNLHSIEQFLSIYNTSEPHYTGWYNHGGPGRKAHGKKVKVAIGAFYGVTREVILRWKDWRSDGRHVWGTFGTGEDSQMAFFLREHGTCLEIPIQNENLANFKESYVWGGFEDIGSPACREKIKWLMDNPCFVCAHKVPLKWMGILTGVLASHIENNATCSLVDKGGSRIVNGSTYHFMENITGCTTDCDPCLRDASGCCSWSPEKEGGSREGKAVLEKTECAFCEGGIPKLDMIVPQTGGNTCGSIQLLAFKDYNGTDTCEILRKQENVCCPEQSIHLALETLSDNAIVRAENIEGEGGGVMSGQEIVKHFASGGRLGNQLFEHAATLAIAKTTGKQACVIGNNVGLIDRYFTDGVFLRNCSNIDPSESVSETGYGIFSPLPKTEGSLEIRGYFQSWKYFAGAEAEIIQAFKLKPKYARDADEIISKGGHDTHHYNVGIHMRWFQGDYLREPPKEYYQKAMQYFRLKYGTERKRVRFYLASTDIERSKNLRIFSDESVVFLNGQNAIFDFAVLMSCDGMILSSGTFGWWAAWLGAHQREGDVLYFGEVFRMSHRKNKGLVNKEDYYPPTWREIAAGDPSFTFSKTGDATLSQASINQPASRPMNCNSYYSVVEIGTSNFDTYIQRMAITEPKATGLSVDAMQIYINQLPNLECWQKLSSAVVGSTEDIPPSGMIDTYFIDPKDIAQHSLPGWLKGCNSVGRPHATAMKELTSRHLTHLMHSISVPVMSVEQLFDNKEICRMKKFKVDVEGLDGDLLVAFSKWVRKKNGACYADEVSGEFNELSDGRVSGDEASLALVEAGYKETGKDGFDRIWKYFGKQASMNTPSPPATIVTAYFNIDSKHPHDDYIRWMKNMLSLKDPMVIFTSPDMVPTFHSLRSHASNSTKIITMELNETLMSRTYDVQFWQDQYAKDPERKAHRSYFLYWIWNEKLEFLRRTIEENPFHSDFFAWVDIGSFRVSNLNDRVMLKQIPAGLKQNQVLGLDVSGFSKNNYMAGNFIGGYRTGILRFHTIFYYLLEANKDSFIGKDQVYFKKACEENKGICLLIKPDMSHGDPWFYMAPYMMGLTT